MEVLVTAIKCISMMIHRMNLVSIAKRVTNFAKPAKDQKTTAKLAQALMALYKMEINANALKIALLFCIILN